MSRLVTAAPDVLSFDALQFLQEEVRWKAEIDLSHRHPDVTARRPTRQYLQPRAASADLRGTVVVPYPGSPDELNKIKDLLAEAMHKRFGPVSAGWRPAEAFGAEFLLTAEEAVVREVAVSMPGFIGSWHGDEWTILIHAQAIGPFHADSLPTPAHYGHPYRVNFDRPV